MSGEAGESPSVFRSVDEVSVYKGRRPHLFPVDEEPEPDPLRAVQ